MRGAAVSLVSNIAEGCGRQSDRELAYFLRVARGSARELECQLLLARDLEYLRENVWRTLDSECQEVSRMLMGLITTVRGRAKPLRPSS
jgi:four helix bundle protein